MLGLVVIKQMCFLSQKCVFSPNECKHKINSYIKYDKNKENSYGSENASAQNQK